MILKFLLNNSMIWIIFKKYLRIYNPNKKFKMLSGFDDMIADIHSKKKPQFPPPPPPPPPPPLL